MNQCFTPVQTLEGEVNAVCPDVDWSRSRKHILVAGGVVGFLGQDVTPVPLGTLPENCGFIAAAHRRRHGKAL